MPQLGTLRSARRPLLALSAAALLGAPLAAAAQADTTVRSTQPAAPAAATREGEAARSAQRAFERYRRDGLRFYNGGAEPTGLVTIGRIIYYDNNGDVPPPEERMDLIRERESLLDLLARAATADPTDTWAAGQRVRYLSEARRFDEAEQAARACRGDAAWCGALVGLTLHQQSAHVPAAAAFDAALAAMSAEQRCEWTDVSLWLEGAAAAEYKALPCGERAAFEAKLWWLAKPLHIQPGNDLRTELLARRVVNRLHSQGDIAFQMSWGPDLEETQSRYGWPTAWSVTTGGAGDPRPPSVIGHEPTPSYDFTPRAAAWAAPLTVGADGWALRSATARMRYAPRYASDGFVPLNHQIARFRRGDSTLYVGAWDVARDRDWGSGLVRAGLVLDDAPTAGDRRAVRDTAPKRGAVAVAAPNAPLLMSLEVEGTAAQKRAARARYAVQPLPADARISDVLLLTRGDPGNQPVLERLLSTVAGSQRVVAGSTVGLYWESYQAASPTAPLSVSIRATRLNTSFVDRARGALRIGARVTPVSVRFNDVGRPDNAPGRTISLSFPEVPPGQYRLDVSVTAPGQPAATSTQVLTVIE